MKRASPEDQLHRAVAQYLALVLKPPTIWTTIGHGGGGRVRGAQLKAKGVKAGWPDIIVISPALSGCIVVGLELKASKGQPSAEQRAMREQFIDAGAEYAICRSIDDVNNVLRGAGIL